MAATSGTILGIYAGGSWYRPYVRWSVTQNSDAIATNKSPMTVTFGMYKASANNTSYNGYSHPLTITVDGTPYTRSVTFDFRSAAVGSYNDIVTISGISIAHNADGTRSVTISASHPSGISLGTGTVSDKVELPTIPRATTPSLSTSTAALGASITISTPRASSAFTHTLRYSFGSKSGQIAAGVASSCNWTLPDTLASAIPNAASGVGDIICDTYNGNTLIGSKSVKFTATIPNTAAFRPTIQANAIAIADTDAALYSKFGGHVQNKSKLNIAINAALAAGAYGSTIAKYSTSVSGRTYTGANVTTAELSQSGTLTVTTTITDSRGRTASASRQITVYPYSNPTITSYKAYRCDENGREASDGEYLGIDAAYQLAAVNDRNDLHVAVRVSMATNDLATFYEECTTPANFNGTITPDTAMSLDYQYNVTLEIWDYFTGERHVSRTQLIETEKVVLDINEDGDGIAIGMVAHRKGLEIPESWPIHAVILRRKDYTVTTAANSNASPYGAYGTLDIGDDITKYGAPVSVTPVVDSNNVASAMFSLQYPTTVFIYSNRAGNIGVRVAYSQQVKEVDSSGG